jgi:hypothetical protein
LVELLGIREGLGKGSRYETEQEETEHAVRAPSVSSQGVAIGYDYLLCGMLLYLVALFYFSLWLSGLG